MPAFFVHGYMGYIYLILTLLYGMLPDIIGFSHYFYVGYLKIIHLIYNKI